MCVVSNGTELLFHLVIQASRANVTFVGSCFKNEFPKLAVSVSLLREARLLSDSKVSICGEEEIRTLEGVSPLPVFETGAFDHSATSP